MMTQDDQAQVLARWLSGPPGGPPPPELDPDVIETAFALRPELAPAPRIDLDDILDSLTSGPLAAPERRVAAAPSPVGEVVAFPGPARTAPTAANATARPSSSWLRWASLAVGGTSSLGLLVAAAAVLLFVALPATRESSPNPKDAPAAMATPQAAAPPPPAEGARDDLASPSSGWGNEAAPEDRIAARAAAKPALRDERAAEPQVATLEQSTRLRANSTIPELELAEDAVADVDLGGEVAAGEAPASIVAKAPMAAEGVAKEDSEPARSVPAATPPDPRSAATPTDLANNGWRRGLDKDTQQMFDRALTEGESAIRSGDPRGGAERLAAAVGAPSRAGQTLANRAAGAYLAAGDPAAAEAVARRGLALSADNTPERSQLLVTLGDALRALGDGAGADQAWQEAAAANASRARR